MADEIINRLGFDVSQAITALGNLDTRLKASGDALQSHGMQLDSWNLKARAALETMRSLAAASKGVGTFAAPGAGTGAGAAGMASAFSPDLMTRISQATELTKTFGGTVSLAGKDLDTIHVSGMRSANALKQMTDQAQMFSVSWSMLGRIIVTQAIVRVISQIRNALQASVVAAIDFQKAIAEIQVISLPTDMFQVLQDEVAELSKRFNIPLPQVAEGLYQTISDQFVEVSDRAQVMEASMKLARVGVADLGKTVEAVTGVLNAYGMAASEAEIVAAKFFEAVKLGRVRMEELSGTIGQVIPIASQLGVSLDEVLASYVSMTIGGLDAHKSATGLRQAMVAFLKPSEDMKKVLQELGYANAEQIIQAKGFVGALMAVGEASGNMASEIGKSLRNVRALTADLSLTRDEAKKYEEAMVAMGNLSSESLQKLFDQFKTMPAEKLTSSINALKVTLTRDFGNMLTGLLGDMIEFAGGADRLASAMQGIAAAAGVLGVALAALAVKALIAQAAMGPLGWTLTAVALGIAAFAGASMYQTAQAVAGLRNLAEERRKTDMEELQALEEKNRSRLAALNKSMEEERRVWMEGAADIRRLYFKSIDDMREENTTLVESSRQTMSSMVAAQERVAATYRNAAKASADAVTSSRQRMIAAEAAYSDAVFRYQHQNENAYARSDSFVRRSIQLTREAVDMMSKAKTPEQTASAQAAFQRAEAAQKEAESIAQATGNAGLLDDAQRVGLWISQQKIDAEKSLQEIQSKEAMQVAGKAADEQSRLNGMKSLMKAILVDLDAFDKGGSKDPLALQEQGDRLKSNIEKMKQLWSKGGAGKMDISEFMELDKLQRRVQVAVEGGVEQVEVKDLYSLPETFDKFRDKIEKGVGPVRVLIESVMPALSPEQQKRMQGMGVGEKFDVITQRVTEVDKVIDDWTKSSDALVTAKDTIQRSKGRVEKSIVDWFELVGKSMFTQTVFLQQRQLSPAFYEKLTDLMKVPEIQWDDTRFLELQKAYSEYLEKVQPSPEVKTVLDNLVREIGVTTSEAVNAAKMAEQLGKDKPRMEEATQLRPALKEGLDAAKKALEDAAKATKEAETGAGAAQEKVSAVSQIDMSTLASQARQFADAMWDAATASMMYRTPSEAGVSARGGRAGRYMAEGGPVGVDTMQGWFSPRETIMNEAASMRFASQLAAMNAGVQPIFRSEGGPVTNIGDINVTVQGGSTGRHTAREIASELRREMRRGTTASLR